MVNSENGNNENNGNNKRPMSERKIEANRRNSLLSTGPRNTERTRFNATKHGLLAKGLTPLDNEEEFEAIVRDLTYLYPPKLDIHEEWIRGAAHEMIKLSRNNLIEAYNIGLLCSQAESKDQNSDKSVKVIDFSMMNEYLGPLMDRTQRYSAASMKRLKFYLELLEPLRREESGQQEVYEDPEGNVTI